jgi:hypothetical protein
VRDNSIHEGGRNGFGEMKESQYVLKVEPIELYSGLDMGSEKRKERMRDNPRPELWGSWRVIYCE